MRERSRVSTGSRTEPEAPIEMAQLSDRQWSAISDLFPDPPVGPKGGRPRTDNRSCLEGILWVLRTGARWKDMPRCFPSYVTCWRRFAAWTFSGVWERAWRRLLDQLEEQGRVNWKQGFADGTFASAKKGAIA